MRASKPRAMLATLALDAGYTVSYADLADELWSGRPPRNTRNALQAHATRLRRIVEGPDRTLAGAVLRTAHNGYVLDVPRDRIDGNRFLDLAGQGSAALRDRPERALELLRSALALWRGPALLDAGDGLRCRGAAALFEERQMAAWEDLAIALLATGDARPAVAELRRLVARHPLRERFCELLMIALYRSGQQGDALELFATTRQWFDEELGLQPGDSLRRRHAEILAQDPALSRPSALLTGPRSPVRSMI